MMDKYQVSILLPFPTKNIDSIPDIYPKRLIMICVYVLSCDLEKAKIGDHEQASSRFRPCLSENLNQGLIS